MPNRPRLPLSVKLEKKLRYFNLLKTLRYIGLLSKPGEQLGGVKLQSREHWAVANYQLIDFGFELLKESDILGC